MKRRIPRSKVVVRIKRNKTARYRAKLKRKNQKRRQRVKR